MNRLKFKTQDDINYRINDCLAILYRLSYTDEDIKTQSNINKEFLNKIIDEYKSSQEIQIIDNEDPPTPEHNDDDDDDKMILEIQRFLLKEKSIMNKIRKKYNKSTNTHKLNQLHQQMNKNVNEFFKSITFEKEPIPNNPQTTKFKPYQSYINTNKN